MNKLTDQELYSLARERVAKKRAFKTHFFIYSIFTVIMFVTFIKSGFEWEVLIPVFGWGAGVLGHFVSLYTSLNSDDAVEREYRKLKDK